MGIVMILAFFLSKWVPGDAAESFLALQGVQQESNNYKIEYERNYKLLNLDEPLFYFSVIPDFYHPNINEIILPLQRQQVSSLLKQKYAYKAILNYISDRDESIKIIKNWKEKNGVISEIMDELLVKASFATEINEIDGVWQTIKPLIADGLHEACPVYRSVEKLTTNKVYWYFPLIKWHGSSNQFHHWVSGLIRGDLGLSIKDGREVSHKILAALKWTLLLAFANFIITGIIAIPSGLAAGYRAGSIYDRISNFVWLILYSIPVFWLASMFIVYCTSSNYASWLNIFPVPGLWYVPDGQSMWTTVVNYSHLLVLPIICLVANDIAQLSRIVRSKVMDQKSEMYVMMAKAKGQSDFKILIKHILPNVMVPLITVLGGKLPAGLSGALIIEVIFNIPGMGRLMYNSIYYADWNVVFGILIIVSLFTILIMLLTDILYAYVNPKVKTALS